MRCSVLMFTLLHPEILSTTTPAAAAGSMEVNRNISTSLPFRLSLNCPIHRLCLLRHQLSRIVSSMSELQLSCQICQRRYRLLIVVIDQEHSAVTPVNFC